MNLIKNEIQNTIKDIVITRLLNQVTAQAQEILNLKAQCDNYKTNFIDTLKYFLKQNSMTISRTTSSTKCLSRNRSSTILLNNNSFKQRTIQVNKKAKSIQQNYHSYILTTPNKMNLNMRKDKNAIQRKRIINQRDNSLNNRLSHSSGIEIKENKVTNVKVYSIKFNQNKVNYSNKSTIKVLKRNHELKKPNKNTFNIISYYPKFQGKNTKRKLNELFPFLINK